MARELLTGKIKVFHDGRVVVQVIDNDLMSWLIMTAQDANTLSEHIEQIHRDMPSLPLPSGYDNSRQRDNAGSPGGGYYKKMQEILNRRVCDKCGNKLLGGDDNG